LLGLLDSRAPAGRGGRPRPPSPSFDHGRRRAPRLRGRSVL